MEIFPPVSSGGGGVDWSKKTPKSFIRPFTNVTPATTETLLNVTGSGYLHFIQCRTSTTTDNISFSISVDGTPLYTDQSFSLSDTYDLVSGILRFNQSLVISVKNSGTQNYSAGVIVTYVLD